MQLFLQFLHDECGATAIEYAIIGVAIAATIAGLVYQFGGEVRDNLFATIPDVVS